MSGVATQRNKLATSGLLLALVLAWYCYQPALTGDFQLDDRANLGGLATVEDLASAIDFALEGTAGPTGRPLALATFALQADAWPRDPAAFLRLNVFLHLLNAVILAFCARELALHRCVGKDQGAMIGALTAALWVLLPVLATASLLVVQRMTLLSSFFMLLGLAGYLCARRSIEAKPNRALTGMVLALVAGTILASLSKESGILLPVFVLVLEVTVLERPGQIEPRKWRLWQAAFLGLPLLALLAYLSTLLAYSESLTLRRDFTALERLMTEARILWLYVHKALLGLPSGLGVFQSSPSPSRSLLEPATFMAISAWLALVVLAFIGRRRRPILALVVLWYLAGHLLESTTVPLELYFEHRNYLPLVGPAFAAAFLVVTAPRRARRFGLAAISLVLIANSYFLHTIASLWGTPAVSAPYWAELYPDSMRAVTNVARYQLERDGPLWAAQTLDDFVVGHPEHAYLRIQELNLLCMTLPGTSHAGVLAALEQELPQAKFTYTAGTMLSELLDTVSDSACHGVRPAKVAQIAGWLQSNPRYQGDRGYNQFHYKLLAAVARIDGDLALALEYLDRAMSYRASSELNTMMVTGLASAGDFDGALKFIDDSYQRAPQNPVRGLGWRRDLDKLRAYILELEAQAKRQQ